MASRVFFLSCLRAEGSSRCLSPRPRYPSMPKYPKGAKAVAAAATSGGGDPEAPLEEEEQKIALFTVIGMTCAACAGSVEKAIKRLPGIHDATVDVLNDRAQVIFYPAFVSEYTIRETIEDVGFEATLIKEEKALVALATEEAEICYDPKLVSTAQLMEVVADTGFEAILITTGEDRNRVELKVDGELGGRSMSMVKNSLQALPGVEDVNIDPVLHKISVAYKSDQTGPRNFIEIIGSTGSGRLRASIYPEGGGRELHKRIKYGLDKKVVNMLSIGELLRWILSTPVQFIIGRRFYTGAYKALRHGSANMDVLVALGTNAAYFYSLYSVLRAATSQSSNKRGQCIVIALYAVHKELLHILI
ncbi:putative Copper-transporting ATPase HMA5 [Cocos nucifera]|uniref:Putative Copper-transporting ATPase HMA5 n=1 Tax=Cocos nucifera TaxID=13894 RepID=A0A8K0N8J1_COCNU|nr:putative Copper-transporting ATPase HMA5 [Cocos nucifera]